MQKRTSGATRLPAELSLLVLGLGVNPNRLAHRIRRVAPGVFARLDVATDLEAARDAVRLDRYDVVLLDCNPLNKDIDEVEHYVRACGLTPVIAISDVDDFQIQEQMLRVGVQDYLVKKKTHASQLISSIIHSIERKRLEIELKSTLGELAQANAELRRLTLRDSLTGVLNRRAFLAFAEQALARCERSGGQLVLLYCDLDRFKQVNDSLGHGAGDEYLRAFCRRVEATLRKSDVIGRLGGDEFVILLEDADWAHALETVQRIKREVTRPLTLEGRELIPSVSVGVASYPSQQTVNELIQHADRAMYEAKRSARSRRNSTASDTGRLASELDSA
ncbi:MAG: GGDEF domain-containing response regulator [Pseudomonadales bacterium]|jgi:diguanylate cyclase (GGDEF)-like protein